MRTIYKILSVFSLIALCGVPIPAKAQTITNFRIIVKAEDAKFVGTSIGGARVIIKDRRTGDIIMQGTTQGSTDGSDALMNDSAGRDAILVSDETSDLEFSLELFEPVPVRVTAIAPLGQPQAEMQASKDMILIPGKDYTDNNGIMLEVGGMAVDVLQPPANHKLPFDPEKTLMVKTNVLKLCGCHVAEDSPWPPERYEVEAHIYLDGLFIMSTPMIYGEEPGIYINKLKFPQAGTYRINVTAYDPITKEAGMDSTSVVLTEQKTDG